MLKSFEKKLFLNVFLEPRTGGTQNDPSINATEFHITYTIIVTLRTGLRHTRSYLILLYFAVEQEMKRVMRTKYFQPNVYMFHCCYFTSIICIFV